MDENVRGGLRALGQGATFGWSDELASALAATGAAARGADWRDAYEDILRAERSGRAGFEKSNPWTSLGLEILGGLPTGIGWAKAAGRLAPKVAAGSPARRRTAAWAASSPLAQGATQGAVAGAGTADDASRAAGAGVGATVGAVTGKAGDLVLRGARKIAEVMGLRGLDKVVADDLLEAMREDGLDPKATLEKIGTLAQRTQKPVTLADVVAEIDPGEHTRKTLDAALSRAGAHRKRVEEFLATRLDQQKENVLADVANAMNQLPRATQETIREMIERRTGMTKDLYQKAFADRTRLRAPELQKLHESGAMDDALKAVREELRLRGEELPVRWATSAELPMIPKALLTGEDAVRGRTPYYSPTLEQYHSMKRHLWDLGEAAKIQNPLGELKTTQISKAYDDARRRLQQLLLGDEGTVGIGGPEYRRAESLFGGESKLIEAAQVGSRLFKTDPGKLREIVRKMDPAEKEALLSGFGGYVEGLPATERSDFARKLIGDSEKLKRLQALLEHRPGAYDALLDRLRTGSQMVSAAADYPGAVRTPSPHAALWAGARAMRGDPKGGAVDYAKHWFEYPHEKYAERMTEFGWGRPGAQEFAGIESLLRQGLPSPRFHGAPAALGGLGGLEALPRQDPDAADALGAALGSLPTNQ